MKGTLVTIDYCSKATTDLDRPVQLDELRAAVGGHLELISGFDTYHHNGVVVNCRAFCNEEGKLKHLPSNPDATLLWQLAMHRKKLPPPLDQLVGPVAVVFGDKRFMAEL